MITATQPPNGNPGIVPPWLGASITTQGAPNRNPGIVPPWLTSPGTQGFIDKDTGIVPPWIGSDDTVTIMTSPNARTSTEFVR